MKQLLPTLLVLVGLIVSTPFAQAADSAESGIRADIKPIITHIQEKLKAGKDKEADMAEDLKAIDGVIARHQNDDKEELAGVYMLKASIYVQVLDNDTKATETLNLVKKDFAGTEAAKGAESMLAQIKAQAASKAIQRSLVTGAKFPDFSEKDLAGKPLSIAGYKGKVVLIDFWATWCGPCRAELPNVIEIYQKNHVQGFEIIGVSLDSDRAKLDSFLKSKGMTWAQYFDGEGWSNKLAKKYGVNSIPMTYLLDREGKIIGKDLRGDELAEAVTKALAQK
jgi:thiol-disulfide isomerase/thioredoxin